MLKPYNYRLISNKDRLDFTLIVAKLCFVNRIALSLSVINFIEILTDYIAELKH